MMTTTSIRSKPIGSKPIAAAALIAAALLGSVACSKTETPQATTASSGAPGSTASTAAGTTGGTARGGTSTSKPAGSTSTTATGSTPTTSGGAPSATDQAAAERALVTDADIPAAFSATTVSASSSPNPFLGVAECSAYEAPIKASEAGRTAKAKAKWVKGDDEITHTVEVYADTAIAMSVADVLTDPGFTKCLETAFTEMMSVGMPPNTSVGEIKATSIDVGSADSLGVDTVAGFGIEMTITQAGESRTFLSTTSLLVMGRTVVQVDTSSSSPIDVSGVIQAAAVSAKAHTPA